MENECNLTQPTLCGFLFKLESLRGSRFRCCRMRGYPSAESQLRPPQAVCSDVEHPGVPCPFQWQVLPSMDYIHFISLNS